MSTISLKQEKNSNNQVRTIVAVGVLIAFSYVCCLLFHFRVSFLSFDLKDAVMTVGAMFFGPIYGLAMSVIVALLEMITISTTGLYGFVMNVIASVAFVCVGSLVYAHRRTLSGAVIGMVLSCVSMTAVMMIANLIITPFYMGASASDVAALIPTLLLPFNLTKAIFNAALVFLIYKPISSALKSAGFLREEGAKSYKPSVLSIAIPAVVAVVAMVFFFIFLQGSFTFA